MEIIKLNRHNITLNKEKIVLALGFFDGVHLGHQEVIKQAKQYAMKNNLKLALLSFDEHSSVILKQKSMKYITPVEEKSLVLEKLGVDIFYVLSFESVVNLPHQQFVEQILMPLNLKAIFVGFDYKYGSKAQGNVLTLQKSTNQQFEVHVIKKQTIKGLKISSTNIRRYLMQGEMKKVETMLGRPFSISGLVIHGDARGRTIGYPTANILTLPNQLLCREGVYVVEIEVDNVKYKAMASIGRNKTFEKNRPITIEVHILDFDKNIYNKYVKIEWLKYLRSEIKFSTVDKLIAQLDQDKINTLHYFTKGE